MMTDPPYGVSYDAEWRGEMGLNPLGANRTGKVAYDDEADWTGAWAVAPADIAYIWHASAFADVVMASLRDAGFEVRQQIIWVKPFAIISRQAYNWQHEPCWYAVRKGSTANWQGDHTQTTIWEAASPNNPRGGSGRDDKTEHPTQKPIDLWLRAIANHTTAGALLYDPFVGSGTAVIAAHRTNRRCYAMDIDPVYCDVICRRFQEHTGTKPVLEATGEPHDFTAG